MGKQGWQRFLWSAIAGIILLSFMSPFIIFTVSFLMVPVLILYVKSSTKQFVIYYAASLLVVYALAAWQGAFLIAVSLFFLPPVLVMGNMYKRKAAARSVITAGSITLLAESLLSLMVASMLGFNPIMKFKQLMGDSINSMSPALRELLPADQDLYLNLLIQIIPVYLIAFVLFYSLVTHGVSRWLLGKTGEQIPGLRPMRERMLPKSFVWFYLIAFAADLFIKPGSDSMIAVLLFNMLLILVPLFALQAISFLFFVAHTKNWNRAMPIIGIILLLVVPPFFFLYSLLGVFDVAFPIRERFKKKL
ncbi:DUF2232 domain-containing protein [Paenibacillus eucommiae]|uniref:Uncharacterized protein YybS (DUF2232 family) n=1 Tax=Paenibacillus eucommiae TaxID=1355755 RepID=A0ABS4J461_9BACL|nr:DUF2232 domain-containing protein [Paenibacillus eucommiae]MBP1994625.1 uncharacterized protein YybS (DUF2232 family) [Paenibacillus eucommiae]